MAEMKVLTDISDEIEKAEVDILYYKDKADMIRNGLDKLDLPQKNRESLERLHAYALRKVQEIRLVQLLMLEHEALMEIVRSN